MLRICTDMKFLLDAKLFPVNNGGYIHDQGGNSKTNTKRE